MNRTRQSRSPGAPNTPFMSWSWPLGLGRMIASAGHDHGTARRRRRIALNPEWLEGRALLSRSSVIVVTILDLKKIEKDGSSATANPDHPIALSSIIDGGSPPSVPNPAPDPPHTELQGLVADAAPLSDSTLAIAAILAPSSGASISLPPAAPQLPVTDDFLAQAPDNRTAAPIGSPLVRITPASGGQAPTNAPEPPGVRVASAAGSPASGDRAGPAPDIRAAVTAVDAALLRVQALSVAGEPAAPEATPLNVPVLPVTGEQTAAAAPSDSAPHDGDRSSPARGDQAPSEGTSRSDPVVPTPDHQIPSDAASSGGPSTPVSGDATATVATPSAGGQLNPAPGGPAPAGIEPRAAGIEAPLAETIEGRQEPSPAAGIASAPGDGDRASTEGTSHGDPAVPTPEDRAASDPASRGGDQVVPVPDHQLLSDSAHRGDRVVPVSGDATATVASPPVGDSLNPAPGGLAPTDLEPRGDGSPVALDRSAGIEAPLTETAVGNVEGRSWEMVLDRSKASKVALAAALVGLIAWRIARRNRRTDREPVRKGQTLPRLKALGGDLGIRRLY